MRSQVQACTPLEKELNDFDRSKLARQIKWSGSLFIANVQGSSKSYDIKGSLRCTISNGDMRQYCTVRLVKGSRCNFL